MNENGYVLNKDLAPVLKDPKFLSHPSLKVRAVQCNLPPSMRTVHPQALGLLPIESGYSTIYTGFKNDPDNHVTQESLLSKFYLDIKIAEIFL